MHKTVNLSGYRGALLLYELRGIWSQRTIFLASDAATLMAEVGAEVVRAAEALWPHFGETLQLELSIEDVNENYAAQLDPVNWDTADLIVLLKRLIKQRCSELTYDQSPTTGIDGAWHELVVDINNTLPDDDSYLLISFESAAPAFMRQLADDEAKREAEEMLRRAPAVLTEESADLLPNADRAAILAGFAMFAQLNKSEWRWLPQPAVRLLFDLIGRYNEQETG